MQRRTFVTGLSAAAFPLKARAGEAGRLPVVALVFGATPIAEMAGPDPISPLVRGFVHRLRDLGWVEGKNIVIERRSAEGDPQRDPQYLRNLRRRAWMLLRSRGRNGIWKPRCKQRGPFRFSPISPPILSPTDS